VSKIAANATNAAVRPIVTQEVETVA
jgi:hypothetical protein